MLLNSLVRRDRLSNPKGALTMKNKKKCPVCRALKLIVKILGLATGTLFVVYFLNLDQKLLAWAYARVNEIFDRKPVDIKF